MIGGAHLYRAVQRCTLLHMDEIPSSEFRKTYASLTEPTRVTVLGRTIGTWIPGGPEALASVLGIKPISTHTQTDYSGERYDTRPLTSAPKPGKKK